MKFLLVLFMLALCSSTAHATTGYSSDCEGKTQGGAGLCVLVTATTGYCQYAHHIPSLPVDRIPCAVVAGATVGVAKSLSRTITPMRNPIGLITAPSLNGAGILRK